MEIIKPDWVFFLNFRYVYPDKTAAFLDKSTHLCHFRLYTL